MANQSSDLKEKLTQLFEGYKLSSGMFYKGGYIPIGNWHYFSLHHYEEADIAPTTNFEVEQLSPEIFYIYVSHGIGRRHTETIVGPTGKVITFIDAFNWQLIDRRKELELKKVRS